jgi:hypothetical protein
MGGAADFSVVACSTLPLGYQWFRATAAILGATDSSLQLTNVQPWQAGVYTVVITNAYGATTSPPAILAVFRQGIVEVASEAALRAAMAGGGTVTFACDGTITLSSPITNNLDVTLDATGHQVTISGNNSVGIFYVATNVQFKAVNLTLANGFASAGAAVLNDGGSVTLGGVTLRFNVANGGGGGAICNLGGTLTATNCWFNTNTAHCAAPSIGGGAIRVAGGQAILHQCSFAGNLALGNSAFSPQQTATGATGGAVHNSGSLAADFCAFSRNAATGGTGYNGYGTPGASAFGGAVWNSGSLSVTRSLFASNSVTGGYGGQGYNGAVVQEQGLPGQNGGSGGSGDGGALFNSGTASLVNCTIAWNTGQGGNGGGGGYGGGGAAHFGGNGGNGGNGGSGFGGVDGTCDLTHCTLAFNSGQAGSGGPGGAGGWGDVTPGTPGSPGTGGGAWGATTCPPMVNTLISSNSPAGNNTFQDPRLGPLADNGGPTLTMALLQGSPAIDAGAGSAFLFTDQRGFPRPAGSAADIGAYESGSVMPTLTIARAGGLNLNIVGYGNTGQVCRLLASTNLLHWVSLATNQIGSNGNALFNDNSGTGACRFYRLVMP